MFLWGVRGALCQLPTQTRWFMAGATTKPATNKQLGHSNFCPYVNMLVDYCGKSAHIYVNNP